MDNRLQVVQAAATTLIALYVASIGTFQWRTAQEKLRLDLYNRRFEVYVQAMTFMQALMQWQSVPESERIEKRIPFVRAVRESKFLFASDPKILALLEDLYNRSFIITGFYEVASALASVMPEQYVNHFEQKTQQEEWLTQFTSKLEPLLMPYLAFYQRGFRSGRKH